MTNEEFLKSVHSDPANLAFPSPQAVGTPETDALIQTGIAIGPREWVEQWDKVIDSHRVIEQDRNRLAAENAELNRNYAAVHEEYKICRERLMIRSDAAEAAERALTARDERIAKFTSLIDAAKALETELSGRDVLGSTEIPWLHVARLTAALKPFEDGK